MVRGLRGLLDYLWMYRPLVLAGVLSLILSDVVQLLVPLVAGRLVDGLAAGVATRADVVRDGRILLALALGTALTRYGWRHFLFQASRLAEVDLRRRLLNRTLALPTSHFAGTSTGEVMALATNDVTSVRMALSMGLVAAFDASVFAFVALLAMAALDLRLTLWTILPFPVLALVMLVSLRLIYERYDRVQSLFEDLTEKIRESLAGIRVLRAYVQEPGDAADFEVHNANYYRSYLDYVRIDSLFRPAIMGLAGLSSAILLGVGGARVVRGETSLGDFTAFSVYLGMLIWPMIAAGWMVTLIQRGAVSMFRISEVLDLEPEPDTLISPDAPLRDRALDGPLQGAVEVRDLTFRYPGSPEPALQGLSFRLARGGSLGIVGEVASGKSTLAALLLRLHNPPEGALLLDGRDILALPLATLRGGISSVPQDSFLFSETIAENLRLGRPDASLEELREACRLAAVDEEVMEFPHGYETLLGERGISLSGGQRQRICLARALLKEAPILVLDDTLSAVDAESERRILDRLTHAASGRTLLVISHRISAVRDLDRIVVLCRGRVLQEGRHEDLLAVPGYYRDLFELQQLEA